MSDNEDQSVEIFDILWVILIVTAGAFLATSKLLELQSGHLTTGENKALIDAMIVSFQLTGTGLGGVGALIKGLLVYG